MEYPFINGHAYSWASIEVTIRGKTYRLIQAISYENARTRGMGRGTTGRKAFRTKGTDEPSASITFYREDFDNIVADLGDGFQDVEAEITCSYAEPGRPTITDTLESCLINTISQEGSDDSEDPLVVECELDIMDILWNGVRGRALPRQ